MTAEQQKKDSFVRHELLNLLKEIDCGIINAEYQIFEDNEYVQVNWQNDYHMKIDVTADSLQALTLYVLSNV